MKQEKKERTISALCAPVLLLILAAGILTVLLGSAAVYQRLNRWGQESGDRRTAALYLTNKIRQAPAVDVQPFGQAEALVIREQVAGEGYVTRIYCHDGWLRELFTPETGEFSPEDGEKVLPLGSLALELEAGMLCIRLTDAQGNQDVLRLLPVQGEEGAP